MSANKEQVGGQHYKAEFQHWDLVWVLGLNYYVGQATKYISRWRLKNGLQDLRKAEHFVRKYLELLDNWRDHGMLAPVAKLLHRALAVMGRPQAPTFSSASPMAAALVLDVFFQNQPHLSFAERDVIAALCTARSYSSLAAARDLLLLLITEAERQQEGGATPAYVDQGRETVSKEEETRL